MSDGMEAIRRDFLIEDLKRVLQEGGITGAVAVEARQTLVETKWLLDLASINKVIRGVVGWVPLVNPRSALNSKAGYKQNPQSGAARGP